ALPRAQDRRELRRQGHLAAKLPLRRAGPVPRDVEARREPARTEPQVPRAVAGCLALRRREDHEDAEVLPDVVKAMLDAGRDIDDCAGPDRTVLVADPDLRA